MIAETLVAGARELRGHVIGEDGDYGIFAGSYSTAAGETVTPETALKVATVYACTSLIGSALAEMPLEVVKPLGDGQTMVPEPNSRLWSLLHDEPNPEMAAGEMWERLIWNVILRGNAYAWLERDTNGQVKAIWPLASGRVYPTRDARTKRKIYAVFGGESRDYVQWVGDTTEVLHIKGDPGRDPLLGVSVIWRLREVIGRSLAEDRHAASQMKNQGRPSGILSVPGKLGNKDVVDRLVEQWQAAYGGSRNSGRTPVLEEGTKWEPVTLSAADLELVQQRAVSREDVAIAFKVPADFVISNEKSANLHYSTDASRDIRLVKYAVMPWARRTQDGLLICQALPWGYPVRTYPRFNPAGLLRADQKSRYEAHQIGIGAGFLTPNEARRTEDLQPIDGLDKTKPLLGPEAQQQR